MNLFSQKDLRHIPNKLSGVQFRVGRTANRPTFYSCSPLYGLMVMILYDSYDSDVHARLVEGLSKWS